MSYSTLWRIFIGLLAFFLLLIPVFSYWTAHPTVLFGSIDLSNFLVRYWWLIVLVSIAVTLIVLAILPLFDLGVPTWVRIGCVLLSLFAPVFLPYWLIRIEWPRWRARQAQKA